MYFISVTTLTDLIASGIELVTSSSVTSSRYFLVMNSSRSPSPPLPSPVRGKLAEYSKKNTNKKKTVEREKQISTSIYNG